MVGQVIGSALLLFGICFAIGTLLTIVFELIKRRRQRKTNKESEGKEEKKE